MLDAALEPLRQALLGQIRRLTAANGPRFDFSRPPGARGWFGPEAVCWRVHSDFVPMIVGGIRALLLQALHPLALAAVWDHSDFRHDLDGRLGRTALFIAATTYGDQAMVEAALARVRAIHAGVRGVAPDGRAYAADDPLLLTWVHVAEVASFLGAWLRLSGERLDGAAQDRYFAETARIARALGAAAVPDTRAGIADYVVMMRPQLTGGERPRIILDRLRGLGRGGLRAALNRPYVEAACALLPDWARRLYALPPNGLREIAVLAAIRPSVPLLRWALHKDGVAAQARRRLAGADAGGSI
jgi:uncharacterized protein (DUF2236 family)